LAKETQSEKLVRIANRKYEALGKGRVKKKDPGYRFTDRGVLHASSGGLDYSGILHDGRHIEFEVKETKDLSLPLRNVRMSQIEEIKKLEKYNADVFLLVFFSKVDEWYRLEWGHLRRIFESEWKSIPLSYFRAFGFVIPSSNTWPEYLSPEQHSFSNQLRSTFPEWMPKPRKRKAPKPIPPHNQLDMDARKKRITAAMERGAKNAERKYQQVQIFKQQKA